MSQRTMGTRGETTQQAPVREDSAIWRRPRRKTEKMKANAAAQRVCTGDPDKNDGVIATGTRAGNAPRWVRWKRPTICSPTNL